MTYEAKLMSGVILLTVPTIEYGGAFLLSVLGGKYSQLGLTGFQKSMFRAGHAHAGVLVILALVVQPFIDDLSFTSQTLTWLLRIGFPLSALLVSGGFFAAAAGKNAEKPNGWIKLIFAGMFVLAAAIITTGIGLIF